jgi:hypothetical protein
VEDTLKVINQMREEGIFREYAIGGAMALLFYAEAFVTYDLDIFCILPDTGSSLVSLAPIYEWLKARGYLEDKEHILIEEIPVQFIPAYNSLVQEAVTSAEERAFRGVPVQVVQIEYLVALMLQTGRTRDRERLERLREEIDIDESKLFPILERHGLINAWPRKGGT